MPDFSADVLKNLLNQAKSDPLVGEDILLPRYDGYSLANIPSTICTLLDVPTFGEDPLDQSLLELLYRPYRNVILLVVDALGYFLFKQLMDSGHADIWKRKLSDSVFFPLTSICPSTTASALTTLWTGISPATHAIIGYEMWAKEYSMVINNIMHSAITFQGDMGGLRRAGFDPNTFLNQPTLGPHLLKHGVSVDAFMHYSIGSSGLSTMHLDRVNLHNFMCESDLWVSLRNLLNSDPAKRRYIYVYWSEIDTLSHRFSFADERIAFQFTDFSQLIDHALLDGLTSNGRKDTLLILTADHGSIYTPRFSQYELVEHPGLMAMLRMMPVCENRLAFLYVKPGKQEAVCDYFTQTWPGKFSMITRDQALEMRLFGPGPDSPMLDDRVGDLVAIARDNAYLWWAPKMNLMLGRHGGLSPQEMVIPFYAMTI